MTLGLMRGVGEAVALEWHLEMKGESFPKNPMAGKGSLLGSVAGREEVNAVPTCA